MFSQHRSLGGAGGRRFVSAALFLLGVFSAGLLAPTASASPQTGVVVGKFELGAPAVSTFVLHGTLPIPGGVFPRADGKHPFGVIDSDGATIPAQCELVSQYADETQGADVVEILARVKRPTGVQPGARITYSIVEFLHTPTTMAPTPATAALFATPGAVTLRARDVFNHRYRADLLRGQDGTQVTRSGSAAIQKRFYETMRPTGSVLGAPTGALPHFLNVHAYATQWLGEDMVSLDLRVHNGPSGKDKLSSIDDPQDKLYFRELELLVPQGWSVICDWRDPAMGPTHAEPGFKVLPIIEALSDGTLHMIPRQGQFERRLVLVKDAVVARAKSLVREEWLGFCRRGTNPQGAQLYSWWNPGTARYFPQRHRLPALDHLNAGSTRSKLSFDLNKNADCLINGGSNGGPVYSPALGWAHPWGVKYGGMTSGTEIYLYDGISTADSASADGYRLSQLSLRMYLDRHPVALYNKDGNPTQYTDWIVHGSQFDYLYMQFYLQLLSGYDPFGFDKAPLYQVNYVANNSLKPAYETALLSHKPIDLQHQVRITRSMKVLTWLGNDAMAKDDLRMQAELVRLSYHDLPNSPSGASMGSGMLSDMHSVEANPGIGFPFGRGEGWSVDTMCAAYSINSRAWRGAARGWFDRIVALVRDGQADCSGTIQRTLSNKMVGGLYYARQSIEQAIVENALWSMVESVYRDAEVNTVNELHTVLRRSVYSMVNYPAWSDAKKGPWGQLAVAPLSLQLPPFCGFIPPSGTSSGVDKFQVWSSFAYGYQLTGDPIFLDKALMMAGGNNLLTSLKNGNYSNLENRAALLSLMQTGP